MNYFPLSFRNGFVVYTFENSTFGERIKHQVEINEGDLYKRDDVNWLMQIKRKLLIFA